MIPALLRLADPARHLVDNRCVRCGRTSKTWKGEGLPRWWQRIGLLLLCEKCAARVKRGGTK